MSSSSLKKNSSLRRFLTFLFPFHGRLEHSIYLPFSIHKSKTKNVYSAESWPSLSVQSRSPKKSLASYRKGNWANSKCYVFATFRCLPFGHENQSIVFFLLRRNTNQKNMYIHWLGKNLTSSICWQQRNIYATIIARQFIAKWKSFCFLYIARFFFFCFLLLTRFFLPFHLGQCRHQLRQTPPSILQRW